MESSEVTPVAVGLRIDSTDLINWISSKLRAIKQMPLLTFTIADCEIILEIEVGVVVPLQCIRDKFQVIPITLVREARPCFFLQVGGWKRAFKMF